MQRTIYALALLAIAVFGVPTGSQAADEEPPITDLLTNVGYIGLNVTNLGYIGHAFSKEYFPSCQYPLYSGTEHMFKGGLWVGAVASDGSKLVSTGAQDARNLTEGDESREFINDVATKVDTLSNNHNSEFYSPAALATQQFNCYFTDYWQNESGNHRPLGLYVKMRTMAWGSTYADDFVILDYTITNISGTELRDAYLGFWSDTMVGNIDLTDPYDPNADPGWAYYDDKNGAWGAAGTGLPGYVTPANDSNIWMTYEHDDDGELGMAESWVGIRLLGTSHVPQPAAGVRPVSYNAWRFKAVPDEDDIYYEVEDIDELNPLDGKYQLMGNGEFDVGQTQEVNFDMVGNWVSLLSTGPFPYWAPGDSINVTFAVTCGPDSLGLLENSQIAQVAYDTGFALPSGPPSPILEFAYVDNSVIIRWEPGTDIDPETELTLPADSPLRGPEHHINQTTARPDFQGYRILRYEGEKFGADPIAQSVLVAELDKIDDRGFNTGLPALTPDGKREFIDTNLKEGHAYWYSVISFSLADEVSGQQGLESGFFENAEKVYPGPAPASAGNPQSVGVYPNPYRVTSAFEPGIGEIETNRKIWFTGLPIRCRIQVFNLVGDLVKTLDHDDPFDGKEDWDLLSEPVRAIASGLYIYVVEDLATGDIQRGKLVIIK